MSRVPWRSTLIAGLIGAQGATFFVGSLAWPIYAYCMYGPARKPPPRTTHTQIVATLADGREYTVDPFELGLGPWAFKEYIRESAEAGEHTLALELMERIRGAKGAEVVTLRRDLLRVRIEDGQLLRQHEFFPIYPFPVSTPAPTPAEAAPEAEGAAGG